MAAAVGGGVVLSTLLNQFFDRTQQTIEQAKNAGLFLEMEAGAQLRQTIENAKIAYADSLNLTIDKVDSTVSKTIDQLKTLVDGAQNRNAEILTNLASRAQQIANTLPFHNDNPQLTSLRPRYVLRTDETPIVFKFQGNFEHAPKAGYAPSLKFMGKDYTASTLTTQQLEFTLTPAQIFPSKTIPNPTLITFSEGSLKVPFPNKLIGQSNATFTVTIGAMPASPGTITLKYTILKTVRDEREKRSQDQRIGSCREDGNNDQIDIPVIARPSEGWRVKRGSSRDETSHWGDCRLPTFVSDHDDVVVWKGSTIHHGMGSSGRMHVTLVFTEWRDREEEEKKTDNIQLKWGDTKAFTPGTDWKKGSDAWKIAFKAFDGSEHEFIGADVNSSPYLKVESQGQGYVVKATKPSELDKLI